MEKIRVIVADDERPAREFLKAVLKELGNTDIVGEAVNGEDALELIRSVRPELAFLDLTMPVMSGLDVARSLALDEMPLIAFVTAYDEFAIQAFDVNAIDYLLKPVERHRVAATIERAADRLRREGWRSHEIHKIESLQSDFVPAHLERIPVKHRDQILLIPVEDVASIVADGELLRLSVNGSRGHTINHRLKDLEARLDPAQFIRLSRGTMANLSMIKSIHPMPGGTYQVLLTNGEEHPTSRAQSRAIRERLLKI